MWCCVQIQCSRQIPSGMTVQGGTARGTLSLWECVDATSALRRYRRARKKTNNWVHTFSRFRRSHRVTRSQMRALLHKNTHTHTRRSFINPPADRLIWRVMYQKVAPSNFWWHVRPITHVVHACVCVFTFKSVWQHTTRYLSLVLKKWQTSWYGKGILWVEAVTDFWDVYSLLLFRGIQPLWKFASLHSFS